MHRKVWFNANAVILMVIVLFVAVGCSVPSVDAETLELSGTVERLNDTAIVIDGRSFTLKSGVSEDVKPGTVVEVRAERQDDGTLAITSIEVQDDNANLNDNADNNSNDNASNVNSNDNAADNGNNNENDNSQPASGGGDNSNTNSNDNRDDDNDDDSGNSGPGGGDDDDNNGHDGGDDDGGNSGSGGGGSDDDD